ncbi:TPA: oligosaccharide flippase family protein [Klebsiella pneumoniae]|uniref:oligosaccharide flippase family protein n=1 Tax=Klebsiella pneumoniae TaxID=573 RepID=UPI001BA75947|nr:oligosaccharide flippase family protein [Klebsiella pneumoniae]MBS2884008.1 oligosaccharide flippase family protein [Klebsiella pneumoniae]MCP5857343.1 oligosaccharide flippase family protein [Klebsiella pneumoniae]WJU14306.1 oligosaccharide flippase family protein [Klebsiella pneumoniae]HBQ6748807.1 oligosaccharide flippase family protein [Klebsiella pneumoniae]HBQ6758550.1 oligosaccharide flippase family protein [Klebsiella pneumoniae]
MKSKIVSNSIWMMLEKIISILGLIFVTSFVAKYVGPEIYGKIAFSLSIFQIILVVSQFGSDVLIFKRVSKSIRSGGNLIVSTIPLRFFTYLLFSIPVIIYNELESHNGVIFIYAAFIACLFQALDVYSIYYDALLLSKINTILNVFSLIICLILRWYIAFEKLDANWLCAPIILTTFIPYILRHIIFARGRNNTKITFRQRYRYTKYLFSAGMSFVLSSISIAIYTRLSLLMLGFMQGQTAVGVFSIALTLAGSWSFILNSIITSNLPSIFSESNNGVTIRKAANLMCLVIMVSVPIIFGVFVMGGWFIEYFYGYDYSSSVIPLRILVFSTMIGALGIISSRFIAKYSGYSFLSKKMILVAILSLVLNVILIHYFSVIGACVATLLTEFLSLTIFNYFYRKESVLKMHLACFKNFGCKFYKSS